MSLPNKLPFKIILKAAIINSAGKLLIIRRADNYPGARAGKWDIPGGNLEVADYQTKPTLELALDREVVEETGIPVSQISKRNVIYSETASLTLTDKPLFVIALGFLYFTKSSITTINLSQEHSEFKWINPNEVEQFDFGDDGGFHPAVIKAAIEYLSKT